MRKLLNDEYFAIAIAIAKCFNRKKSLDDFSLYADQKTADRPVSKWPPAVQNGSPLFLGWIFRLTGIGKWPP